MKFVDKFVIIVVAFLIILAFYLQLPKFETGDCIRNNVNNKVGRIIHYVDEVYWVDFPNEMYKIKKDAQFNFTKVKCNQRIR